MAKTPVKKTNSRVAKPSQRAGSPKPARRGERPRRKGGIQALRSAARNALEILREGRLGAPYAAPFDVALQRPVFTLRHYHPEAGAIRPGSQPPIVLVPPLMVASEVYDISPELSAVAALGAAGLDVWLVDFGAPEHRPGGMERTLDDHVRAVDEAVDHVAHATRRDVHLAGYSQGGMFAYQTAAFRRSAQLASVITFGSPVDVHRNLPGVPKRAAERMIGAARSGIENALERIDGLPGILTSTGFKLLSIRKELNQRLQLLTKLHDREAMARDESKRRFLGGEGFVAWPGPALRKFVDDFVVMNRMMKGGFVIDGRTVTLADITCPILYFVGLRDDIARPPGVRAVRKAATRSSTYEAALPAGHFGLVVGSTAMRLGWPTVIDWVRWREGLAGRPELLAPDGGAAKGKMRRRRGPLPRGPSSPEQAPAPAEAVYDATTDAIDGMWNALGDVSKTVGAMVDHLRWQAPRLARMSAIEDQDRVSLGRALTEQARAIPDKTFFLWEGRAFTYQQAEERVDHVVRGLIQCGLRPTSRVGVLMGVRPSYLTIVGAVSRLGAASVLLPPTSTGAGLTRAIELAGCDVVITDPEHARDARSAFRGGRVAVLGGGPGGPRGLPRNVINLEAIDPATVKLPDWYRRNPGRADELALVLFTSSRRGGEPRAARITNRRWAASALGAAAACTLTTRDTVYCCLPPHHAAGMLAAIGGALVGGARLALAPSFRPPLFWEEVRRYGASVVFYAGEMCRGLLEAQPSETEHQHPVRLFAGSGMRTSVWRALEKRFAPAKVLEIYASTEGNCLLANGDHAHLGSVGKPLPGTSELALVAWDFAHEGLQRNAEGSSTRVSPGAVGVLLARLDPGRPGLGFDGYTTDRDTAHRIARDVFEAGDRWFVTGDLMRRDRHGDHWLVDNLADVIRTQAGPVFTRQLEDVAEELVGVRLAAAYGIASGSERGEDAALAIELERDASLDPEALLGHLRERLPERSLPAYVIFPERIELTEGYRPRKPWLRAAGLDLEPMRAPGLELSGDGRSFVSLGKTGRRPSRGGARQRTRTRA